MRTLCRAALFLALASAAAFSAPLTWTFSGVTFDDGGTLSGTFDFDPNTGSPSNWNMVASAGTTLGAFTYDPTDSTGGNCGGSTCLSFFSNATFPIGGGLTENRVLVLQFASPLTSAGGTSAIAVNLTGSGPRECLNCAFNRNITAGSVSAPLGQTLTFDPIPNQLFGTPPFPIAAQTDFRQPVTFGSTTPSVCIVAGDAVAILNTGTCSITASQAGSAGFQPVTGSQSFNVTRAGPAGILNAGASALTAGNGAVGSVIHDFNGDGFPDIAITNYLANSVSVFLGSAAGTFTQATGSPFAVGASEPFGIVVGDFNGDGFPDLATSNYVSASVSILLGDGTGNFSTPRGNPFSTGSTSINGVLIPTQPFSLAIIDFNGDGIQDLVTANDVTNNISVLLGSGTGTFTLRNQFAVGKGPHAVAVADFNGDGKPDFAVANTTDGTVSVVLNNGSGGVFSPAASPFAVGSQPFSVTVADFNGDGNADLALANNGSNNITVLLGNGTGNFGAGPNSPIAVGVGPFAAAVADFDGDGIPDIATGNSQDNTVSLLLGDGTGRFTNAGGSPFAANDSPIFIAAGDLNGDGIEDLVLPDNGGTVTLLVGGLAATNSVLSTTSGSPIFVGTTVPLTLTVSPATTAFRTPTGTGTFLDGTNPIGTAGQTGSPYTFTASGLAAGSHTFSANYGGGSGSGGSTSNTVTITVQKLPQTITFNALPNVTFGVAPFTISATASSGLTVIFSSNTTSVCTVSGNTVTAVAPGSCSITANQPGDATYLAATPVTQAFTVLQTQTITFNPLPNVVIGVAPFTITASATSGLTVTFTSNTTPVCTVSGTTVTALTPGTCSITANQSGNAVYAAAPPVTQTFTVLQTQTITFGTLSSVTVGVSPFVVGATANSGLTVVFTSNTASVCSLTGTTVAIVGPGTCSITASQPGNATFAAATPVTQSFTVYPQLTLSGLPTINTTVGASVSFTIAASGGSGTYTYSFSGLPAGLTSGGASVSGSPAQAGTFFAQVTVHDTIGNTANAVLTVSVLGLTTTSLPAGTVGQAYGVTFGAAGGSGGYTFAATGLPSGLTISPDGNLNGTPRAGGTFAVTITVSSGGVSARGTFSLTITNAQPITISSARLPDGTANTAYSQTLNASGGFPPYTWSVSTGSTPPGLSLSSSGTVSGTPTAPGSYAFGVMATDTAGGTATATASLTIQPQPLQITTRSLPAGMFGVNYPTQQFTVSGGAPPFVWNLANGSSLPQGLTFTSDGVLSGTPQAAASSSVGSGTVGHATTASDSTYQTGVVVTDSKGTQSNFTLSLAIRPPAADLVLTAGALNFALSMPSSGVPPPQKVGVQSTQPSQPITYALTMEPVVSWLSLSNGTTTPDSIQVSVAQSALTLAVGAYQTVLKATCTSSSCQGNTQSVTVTLNVTAAPPKLEIDTNLLSFATLSGLSGTLSQPINVKNAGGGSLSFTSVSCQAPYCTVSAAPSLAGGTVATIPVTVNPIGLNAGFYRTQVDIATSAGTGSVPVTFFIAPNATMALAPAGQQFSMTAGGAPGNGNGSFLVVVQGSPITFSAAIVSETGIPAPSWLKLGTSTNSATSTQPGTVTFSIDPVAASALSPGAYYGVIRISSLDVNDSPQNFEVVLNVAPANTPVAPDPQPAGLLFITQAGGTLPPQTVTVYSNSNSASTFQAAAVTVAGGNWLSVTPATGTASQAVPGLSTVSVDASKLSAGVYQGSVSYSLSATAVRSVNVTLIVTASGGAATSSVSSLSNNEQPRAACTASALVPTQTGLVNSFSQAAGWPTPLQIQLSNNCGGVVANGQVVASFSNGDPPLLLPVADGAQGLYTGTWAPAHSTSQVAINVRATAPGFAAATSQINGAVLPNAVPVLSPNGTLHSFDPLVGGALAPGTIVAIYGQNLAGGTSQPETIPLPSTFNGTTVIIGGAQAPLYYVSPSQVNAQIPFELLPGSRYDVIVSANGALTTPQPIQLTPAAPGLAAFTDGTLIAQHSTDGSLVSQSAPAKAGEYVVAYLAGLGDTTVQVASGAASPSSPLAQPRDPPVLTINGNTYPTVFAGLTPGLVGLYQINFQAPQGLPAGNINIVVTQNGIPSNATVLPYTP